jgi:hypothetical protein
MSLFTSTQRRLGYVALGACIAALTGVGALRPANAASTTTPTSFVAIEPIRVLDTRVTETRVTDRTGLIEMRLTEQIALPNGRIVELIPASATAVSLNVTAVDGIDRNGFGFVTVHPCDVATPDTSNLNFKTGQTVPNAVIAPLSPDGRVCFAVYGSAHLLADLNGYFEPLSDTPRDSSATTRYTDREIDNLLDDKADADVVASLSEIVDGLSNDAITSDRVEAVEADLGELGQSVDSLTSAVDGHISTLDGVTSMLETVESTLANHAAQLQQVSATASTPHRVVSLPSTALTGFVSTGSDIALRLSGLPVIAIGRPGGDLVIINCEDRVCSTSTSVTISDPNGDSIGTTPSIAIGIDGTPVIVHQNLSDSDLAVTACDDDACSTAITTTISTPEIDGITPDVTIGRNGFPTIAHQAHDANTLPRVGHLRVLTCNDRACAGTGTLSPTHSSAATGDATSQVAAGFMPSITIGIDGFPVLAHQVRSHSGESITASELQLVACDDAACVGGNEHEVVVRSGAGGNIGWNPKVTMTPGGTSLIAHVDGSTLLITECRNAACFALNTATIASDAISTTGSIDLHLGSVGQPIVSYTSTADDLHLAVCHPSGCSTSAVTTTLETDDIDGIAPRFVVDDIGRPIIVSTNLFGDLTIDVPWWVTPG